MTIGNLGNQIASHLAHAKREAAQGRRVSEAGIQRDFMRHWAINWKVNHQMRLKAEAADCLKRAIRWRDISINSQRIYGGVR